MRLFQSYAPLLGGAVLAACSDSPPPSDTLNAPAGASLEKSVSGGPTVGPVVSAGMTWTGPGTKNYGVLPTNLEIYFARVTP